MNTQILAILLPTGMVVVFDLTPKKRNHRHLTGWIVKPRLMRQTWHHRTIEVLKD